VVGLGSVGGVLVAFGIPHRLHQLVFGSRPQFSVSSDFYSGVVLVSNRAASCNLQVKRVYTGVSYTRYRCVVSNNPHKPHDTLIEV
jgi:hypothetical protein